MTDENMVKQDGEDTEQIASAVGEGYALELRWKIIQLIYGDGHEKENLFNHAEQIYEYVMNGRPGNS